MSAERDPLTEVERLIDELEAFAEKPSPFWKPNHILVRDEDFFRITQRLREALPGELADARATLEKRDLIMRNAQDEHKRILDTAERRLEDLLSDEQIVVAARGEAEKILDRARAEGENVKRDALVYTAELLEDMEKQFAQTLTTIQKGRRFIETEIARGPAGAAPAASQAAEVAK